MDYFPLFADLRRQACLIVGGGAVATRKAAELVAAGAWLTVNAPEYTPALLDLAERGKLRLSQGPFDPGLVSGHILVIAATSDPETNRAVAAAAQAALRLCNVVDDGPGSTFITPAIVDRSPVIVAVSSGGRAPPGAHHPPATGAVAPGRAGKPGRLGGHLAGPRPRAIAGAGTEAVLPGAIARRPRGQGGPGRRHRRGGPHGELAPRRRDDQRTTRRAGMARRGRTRRSRADSVRGLSVLQQADVILHDRLVSTELLRSARREAEIICVGKTGGAPSASQDDINRLLVARVRAGLRVCRLRRGAIR